MRREIEHNFELLNQLNDNMLYLGQVVFEDKYIIYHFEIGNTDTKEIYEEFKTQKELNNYILKSIKESKMLWNRVS